MWRAKAHYWGHLPTFPTIHSLMMSCCMTRATFSILLDACGIALSLRQWQPNRSDTAVICVATRRVLQNFIFSCLMLVLAYCDQKCTNMVQTETGIAQWYMHWSDCVATQHTQRKAHEEIRCTDMHNAPWEDKCTNGRETRRQNLHKEPRRAQDEMHTDMKLNMVMHAQWSEHAHRYKTNTDNVMHVDAPAWPHHVLFDESVVGWVIWLHAASLIGHDHVRSKNRAWHTHAISFQNIFGVEPWWLKEAPLWW